ncbi:MAG: hypothetical protein AAFR67_05050 [Chloroflexota bacterium]
MVYFVRRQNIILSGDTMQHEKPQMTLGIGLLAGVLTGFVLNSLVIGIIVGLVFMLTLCPENKETSTDAI